MTSPDRRHLNRIILLSCLAVLASSSAGAGQEPDSLPVIGDSALIRIWAPETGLKGSKATFGAWADTALLAMRTRNREPLAVPFSDITRLDVRTHRSVGLGVLRGASVGGSVGMIVGLLVGMSATENCTGFLCGLEAFNYAGYGMLVGAGLGGVMGAAAPVDRWTRQELPRSQGFPEGRKDNYMRDVLIGFGLGMLLIGLGGG